MLYVLRVQFSCGYFIADMGMVVAFYPVLGGYEFVSLSYLNLVHFVSFSEKICMCKICTGIDLSKSFVVCLSRFAILLNISRLWKYGVRATNSV